MAASSAPTLLQPSRPHRAGHLLRHTPIDAAPPPSRSKLRHRLRSPDWATMRPSFTLRRFKESRERSQSAARGNGFPKSTGLFASPLHCLVGHFDCIHLRRTESTISARPHATNAAGKNQTILKGNHPIRSAKRPTPTRIRKTPQPIPFRSSLLESVTGYSPSLPNAGDQRLAALGDPHRPFLSRVRCIALLWANLPLRRIIAPGRTLPRCRQTDNLGRTQLLTGTPDWTRFHQGQRLHWTRPRPAHQSA